MIHIEYHYYFRSKNPQVTGIKAIITTAPTLTLNQTKLGYPRDLWELYDIVAKDWTWYDNKDKCGYCGSEEGGFNTKIKGDEKE
jgi:hypothetical protein